MASSGRTRRSTYGARSAVVDGFTIGHVDHPAAAERDADRVVGGADLGGRQAHRETRRPRRLIVDPDFENRQAPTVAVEQSPERRAPRLGVFDPRRRRASSATPGCVARRSRSAVDRARRRARRRDASTCTATGKGRLPARSSTRQRCAGAIVLDREAWWRARRAVSVCGAAAGAAVAASNQADAMSASRVPGRFFTSMPRRPGNRTDGAESATRDDRPQPVAESGQAEVMGKSEPGRKSNARRVRIELPRVDGEDRGAPGTIQPIDRVQDPARRAHAQSPSPAERHHLPESIGDERRHFDESARPPFGVRADAADSAATRPSSTAPCSHPP